MQIFPAAVTALEMAIVAADKAQKQIEHTASWASRAADEIEATKWTRLIEAALGKPVELLALRVRYDEQTLGFMSAWLAYTLDRIQVMDLFQPLCEGIREVIALHDTTWPDKARNLRLPQILECIALRAIEVHRNGLSLVDQCNSCDGLVDRAYEIMVEAFGKLALDLRKLHVTEYERYTTELIVNGRAYQSFLEPDVDLRNVYKVRFVDCVQSKHPYSEKLAELMESVEAARKATRAAIKKMYGEQSGSVSEMQHAKRMIDLLHGKSRGYGTPNIDAQVKAQNERRSDLLFAIGKLQLLYHELLQALVLAGAETAELLKDIQAERYCTSDRNLTIKICMNNCLAADLFLREIGREIAELQNSEGRHLSLGIGRLALAAAYEEAARLYRPFERITEPQV